MLYYPKIASSRNAPNSRCVAFEKYDVWMAKIKTYAYMERLKQAFADRREYWE